MSDQVKLKIDLHNGVVELESSEAFTKAELPGILELLKSAKPKAPAPEKTDASGGSSDDALTIIDNQFKNLPDILEAVKPDTNNEIVATCAYFWAFCDKEHGAEFKNNEVLELYTGPIRRNKPARSSNLCSDAAKQTSWIRAGGKKGYWQISDPGQKFIEGKLKK